mmetsp:Transcript_112397/g.303393  ORF Transcript_112397/g.303393 Transcript_112397/m.303393 type:complete len:390 (-) Transcript_112397:17-1186(-)
MPARPAGRVAHGGIALLCGLFGRSLLVGSDPAAGMSFTDEQALPSSWRWELWSPSDKAWYAALRERWSSVAASAAAAAGAEALREPAIPAKIHQVWLGSKEIPEHCREMMATWSEKHPTWEYRLWTDVDLPEAGLPPRLADLFACAENPAEKSDVLRLWLVLKYGGLYADVDFECFRPVDVLLQRFSFVTGLSNVGAFELNNGLFAASPGHPLLQYMCDHVSEPWAAWGAADVAQGEAVAFQLQRSGMLGLDFGPPAGRAAFLATTGPGFFTRAVMRGLTHAPGLECVAAHPGTACGAGAPTDAADGDAPKPALAPVIICPAAVFYPLPNSGRSLPREAKLALIHKSQAYEAEAGAEASNPLRLWGIEPPLAAHHWCRTWDPDLTGGSG